MARNALGLEFGRAARLFKRSGGVWNCLWGHALKRSTGIIRKIRVSHPSLGFLSSATWPSLQKKQQQYNGLNQTKSKTLNKCKTQNEIVFNIRLHHTETINSVSLNSLSRIRQAYVQPIFHFEVRCFEMAHTVNKTSTKQ